MRARTREINSDERPDKRLKAGLNQIFVAVGRMAWSEKTRGMVMFKPNGEFISAWQMSPKQMAHWIEKDEIR